MDRVIVGLHRDAAGDWVAELDCGHQQHVRHRPPFEVRRWLLTEETRAERIGTVRDCPLCDRPLPPDRAERARVPRDEGAGGGEAACVAHLVCPDCGAVLDGSGHRPGCRRG